RLTVDDVEGISAKRWERGERRSGGRGLEKLAAVDVEGCAGPGIESSGFHVRSMNCSACPAQPPAAEIIATYCHASPRGMRILCDYLTVLGLLTKSGGQYALTPDSDVFLNPKSPGYAGGTLEF